MTAVRILLAEDERLVAEDLQDRLRALGYEVAGIAASGEEAAALAEAVHPDLALMDIRLEGKLDGIAAAQQIGQTHDIPVVYLTAFADPATLERAKLTGPFGYLLKPVRDRELLTALEVALYKHRLERQLREREQWLHTTLRSVADAVITTDDQGRVSFLNPVAECVTGWLQAKAQGRPATEVFPLLDEQTGQPAACLVQRCLRGGSPLSLTQPALLRCRGGATKPVEATAAPIKRDRGRVSGVVLIFRDVTQRRQWEQQLRQAQKLEAIGQLAGGVAHNINNLMTVVLGCGHMLRHQVSLAPPQQELLDSMVQSGERAAAVARQLLAFGRKQLLIPCVLPLNQFVSDLAQTLRRLLREGVEVEFRLACTPLFVSADPVQLQNTLVTLALNARDAMPQGGTFTLETSHAYLDAQYARSDPDVGPGSYVLLTIQDTGAGMDEQTRSHLFEPFYTTKEVGEGAGLGLAAIYGFVKQSGGHLEVDSLPGHGTTIRLYLPSAAPVTEVPGPGLREIRGGNETILAVGPDEAIRKLASTVLQMKGYTVLQASREDEALAFAAGHQPGIDLLVFDLETWENGAPRLVAQLTRQLPRLKVVYLAGPDAAPPREEIASAAFVLKPFSPMVLAGRVRKLLDSQGAPPAFGGGDTPPAQVRA